MDIVTHGMIGLALALPLVAEHPEIACGIAVGSVLPDVDALSRALGKRAFLRFHQTYTHSLPVICVIATIAYIALRLLGTGGERAVLGVAGGMILHSLLDYTNTFGIALFAPFSSRRRCRTWVFFIDVPMSVGTALVLLVSGRAHLRSLPHGPWSALAYLFLLALYVTARAALHRRALTIAPAGTVSLLPTALVPWRFLGCARGEASGGETVQLFELSAWRGAVRVVETHRSVGDQYLSVLEQLAEYRTMIAMTPLYRVVAVEESGTAGGVRIRCRDLRTRNFGTRFGDLAVTIRDGRASDVEWSV